MGHKISKEQIDPGVKDYIMSFVGDINELETDDKSNIINAVNSLMVDRVDNAENMGKLANAIGEPVTANHSVDEVVEGLGEMLSTFKTNMMNSGVVVESSDKFKSLIDKIKGLTEGEGNKGVQFAEGDFSITSSSTDDSYKMIQSTTPFKPDLLVCYFLSETGGNSIIIYNSLISSTTFDTFLTDVGYYNTPVNHNGGYITDTGFLLPIGVVNITPTKWYAIGIGEEDTTLRDSLASILEEEGVSVTEEDDMASLITKVDEEFNDKENEISNLETELSGKVTPAGTAVASNVLTGKTFINSTGSTLTGTMANNGTKTITPSASTQTLGAGYYDKITINGDSDLIAANIVTGKNIFGVNGSAGSNHYSMFSLSQTQISGYTIGDVFEIVGNTTNVKQITLSYGSTLQYSPSRVIINIPTIYSRIQDAYPYYNVIIDSYAAFGANNFVYLSHPGGLNPMYYDLKIYITDISKTGCVLNFATNGKYSNDLIMPDTFHISVIG